VYLGLLVLTLVAAFTVNPPANSIVVLICVIMQSCALTWYMLSYIPFARQAVTNCLGVCCGDIDEAF
jgi:hypothetical protein